MITSEKQLNVTTEKIESLKQSLKSPAAKNIKPIFLKAAQIETQALIKQLEAQVKEYNTLRSEGVKAIKINSPSDWLLLPVRFRIAKHMTQDAFSNLVNVSVRQIARYEVEEYENVQTDTLKKILDQLPISISSFVIEDKKIS